MENLFLFLKGLIIGLGKVIPGVSGSLLAILFHVYDEAILAFNHFFEDVFHHFSYLFFLGSGIGVSILLFSKVLLYFFNRFEGAFMVLFLGLILGSIWPYHKTVCFSKKIYFLLFFIPFFLPFFFTIFHFSWKVQTPFEFLLLGGLDALTMIVPGISGTSLFFMLGCYSTVLSVFGDPITHFFSFCFYLLGMLLGGVFTIRVVEIILRNYKNAFACLVDGLLWSTAISFGYLVFSSISWTMIVLYFPLFFLGFLLSFLFG